MDRDTVLTLAECELRRLPLDAVEAFLLSQVDGRLTLEEIGEVAGLDFLKTVRLAKRLVELGAVSTSKAPKSTSWRSERTSVRTDPRAETQAVRTDPRAEKQSVRPVAQRAEKQPVRTDPRAEKQSVRPVAQRAEKPSVRPEARKERRRSTKSLLAVRSASVRSAPRAADEACELDEATLARITTLDAKLGTVDHYGLLEVERGAEKRDIKRAYFAMASKFHPDRFFGKKLGPARAPVDRIFMRLTLAHDILSNPARRAEYDATLPGPPQPPPMVVRPSRRLSKALLKAQTEPPRRPSKALMAAMAATPIPVVIVPPEIGAPQVEPPPSVGSPNTPAVPVSEGGFRRIYAAAKQIEGQRHIDLFLKAAEEALKVDDVIGAANNYRLALQVSEDAFIRQRFEAVDAFARTRRYEQSLERARKAEREKRWADAASHFARAYEARPEGAVAERAAYALRVSGGDLDRAAELAEQAVSLEPKNAAYRVTLAEVCFAANLTERAATEAARALELAPNNPGAKALAAAIKKMK